MAGYAFGGDMISQLVPRGDPDPTAAWLIS